MKFVAVLNKKCEPDALLSALAHVSAGVGYSARLDPRMNFVVYVDADGEQYKNISNWPFIVLRATQSELRRLRNELTEAGLEYSCYLSSMRSGGTSEQLQATRERRADELEILAIAAYAQADVINPLTKRLSLWKN